MHATSRSVRLGALFAAVFSIGVGVAGILVPDSLTAIRRQYFATPERLYAAAAFRMAMGIVVILAAATSRAPKILRALGALMFLQGLTATLLGNDRARAVVEWESMQGHAILRVGAAVALAAGVFMAYAVTGHVSGARTRD